MGIIDWLFCDNTPDTSEISKNKNEKISNNNDLDATDCNKVDMVNYNDKDFIQTYNNNLLSQLESNIQKHMYKIDCNGKEFFICRMIYSRPYSNKEYYAEDYKLKHKEMKVSIMFNVISKHEKDINRYSLSMTGETYNISVNISELINAETLINKMSDEFFKKYHAKNKAKKDVEKFFNKVGKFHEN